MGSVENINFCNGKYDNWDSHDFASLIEIGKQSRRVKYPIYITDS